MILNVNDIQRDSWAFKTGGDGGGGGGGEGGEGEGQNYRQNELKRQCYSLGFMGL